MIRMNPGPSSVRFFSNSAQSTMSGFSSLNVQPSLPITSGMVPTVGLVTAQRVKFSLSFAAVERVAAAAEVEPERNCAKLEVAAKGVEEVAAVALGKLIGAVAEHDEAGRAGFDLGDVAKLDPLAPGRGRRVGLDRMFEPAVELTGRDTPAPLVPEVERDLEDRIDALSGLRGDREKWYVPQLRQSLAKRLLDPVEQGRGMFGDVPFVDGDDETPTLFDDLAGDAQVLRLQSSSGVQQQDYNFGKIDCPFRVSGREPLELVLYLRAFPEARGVDQPHGATIPLPVEADRIARDSRLRAGDHPFLADHPIDQGRLAGIRPPDDGELQWIMPVGEIRLGFEMLMLDVRAEGLEQVGDTFAMLGA